MGKLAHEVREEFPPHHRAENHAERKLLMAKIPLKVEIGALRAAHALESLSMKPRFIGTQWNHIFGTFSSALVSKIGDQFQTR